MKREDKLLRCLNELERYHDFKLTEQGLIDYAYMLKEQLVEDVEQAMALWKERNSPQAQFPPVIKIVTLILEATNMRHRKVKEAEKQMTLKAAVERVSKKNREHAMNFFSLVNSLPALGREEYLRLMEQMEKAHPGCGWKEEVERLKKIWFAVVS